MSDLVPTDPEWAKAIQEAAKLGSKSVETAQQLGGFLSRVFGTVPQDTVGLLLGDWLHYVRMAVWAKLEELTRKTLERRGVKNTEHVSPSLALPLFTAAQDETHEELLDLWARLLAAAMDPSRRDRVRKSFIKIVAQFDPIDALVFHKIAEGAQRSSKNRDAIATELKSRLDQIEVSFIKLQELNCVEIRSNVPRDVALSAFGRELVFALSD